MAGLPELADVSTTLLAGAPEIQVVYDRDLLSRYDLDIRTVARLVRDKVQGYEATRYNLLDRTVPVIVRLAEEDRRTVEDVEEVVINPGGERPIRLSAVAAVVVGEGPSEVRRVDAGRVGLVRANLASGSLSEAVERIRGELEDRIDWPAGMTFYLSGQNEEWERSRGSLFLALGLSIFLVYVIMAIQFESLLHPLVIMFTILIMLAGIVVNNAIVLVDYINQLRRRGIQRDEAIVTAGNVRLRPILMTTSTTVLGLLPMALGLGDGAEIRTPMALTVISGLIASTALTLVVIPTVYAVADGLAARVVRSRRESRAVPMESIGTVPD
jgi:HAE1 family hydrophobic/amphiphilic exporter-1